MDTDDLEDEKDDDQNGEEGEQSGRSKKKKKSSAKKATTKKLDIPTKKVDKFSKPQLPSKSKAVPSVS